MGVKVLAKFCKKCGSKIDDDAVFCVNCGTKVVGGGSLPAPSAVSANSKGTSLGPDYATKDESLSWWNWRGRLNRQRFILRTAILTTLIIILYFIALIFATVVTGSGDEEVASAMLIIMVLCALPVMLPLIVLSYFMTIKRGHDLNIQGWIVVIICLLGGAGILTIYFSIAKGNEGPNQYGDNPLKWPGSI